MIAFIIHSNRLGTYYLNNSIAAEQLSAAATQTSDMQKHNDWHQQVRNSSQKHLTNSFLGEHFGSTGFCLPQSSLKTYLVRKVNQTTNMCKTDSKGDWVKLHVPGEYNNEDTALLKHAQVDYIHFLWEIIYDTYIYKHLQLWIARTLSEVDSQSTENKRVFFRNGNPHSSLSCVAYLR